MSQRHSGPWRASAKWMAVSLPAMVLLPVAVAVLVGVAVPEARAAGRNPGQLVETEACARGEPFLSWPPRWCEGKLLAVVGSAAEAEQSLGGGKGKKGWGGARLLLVLVLMAEEVMLREVNDRRWMLLRVVDDASEMWCR